MIQAPFAEQAGPAYNAVGNEHSVVQSGMSDHDGEYDPEMGISIA
jgi:hypothetical protein